MTVSRPANSSQPEASGLFVSVAIVGAGMAGLSCARHLADAGVTVCVVDKGRVPGGRMSTRRHGDLQFDHGAQYFTITDARFAAAVSAWIDEGVVAKWPNRMVELSQGRAEPIKRRFSGHVGLPGMGSVAERLAEGIDVLTNRRVSRLINSPAGWQLIGDDGLTLLDAETVVVAVPSPQAAKLLAVAPSLSEQAVLSAMSPCWAVMVAFDAPLGVDFDAAIVQRSPLAWLARDGGKPGRSETDTWVLHASHAWSVDHLDHSAEEVREALLADFAHQVGRLPPITYAAVHLWRYALADQPLDSPYLFDPQLGIGACGDWCIGPKVEAAYLSGLAMANCLLSERRGVS